MKGTGLSQFQGLQFCANFFLPLGAGGWVQGATEETPRASVLLTHSLSHHCDIFKSHHLSLTLLPGMIAVQYLLSSHIQIKVVCTVKNTTTDGHFCDDSSWDRPPFHASLPHPAEGLTAQPAASLASGTAAREAWLVPRAWGSCHYDFSKGDLRASSRNRTHGLRKAAGALAWPGR